MLVASIFGGFENITIWLRFNFEILLEGSGWVHIFHLVTGVYQYYGGLVSPCLLCPTLYMYCKTINYWRRFISPNSRQMKKMWTASNNNSFFQIVIFSKPPNIIALLLDMYYEGLVSPCVLCPSLYMYYVGLVSPCVLCPSLYMYYVGLVSPCVLCPTPRHVPWRISLSLRTVSLSIHVLQRISLSLSTVTSPIHVLYRWRISLSLCTVSLSYTCTMKD